MIDIPLQRLDPDLPLPRRMRAGDAAADLPARVSLTIGPGDRALVPTGFAVAVPDDMCALVLPRSGLSLKQGVTVMNGPGLVDSGYRGELQVILHNTSDIPFEVERGQRIAQLMILPVPPIAFVEVDQLPPASDDRGASGFGSSGS